MGKNNHSFFSTLATGWFVLKYGWLILMIIIALGGILFVVVKDLDKEYKQYGYTGFWDNIKYDHWTGEIIPKTEIETYSSDEKFITNAKGDKVTVYKIKELIAQFEEIVGDKTDFNEADVDKIEAICNVLLKEYLDLDYEITPASKNSTYYYIKLSEKQKDLEYHTISTTRELEETSKEVFKKTYRKENGLK